MNREKIRLPAERVEINTFPSRHRRALVHQHPAAHGPRHLPDLTSDIAEADNSPRFPCDFMIHRPQAIGSAPAGIGAAAHRFGIFRQMRHQRKRHGERHLRHALGGVPHHIANRNPVRTAPIQIHIVKAGGGNADQPQLRRAGQHLCGHAHLVQNCNLRAAQMCGQLFRRRLLPYAQLSELPEQLKVQVIS